MTPPELFSSVSVDDRSRALDSLENIPANELARTAGRHVLERWFS